MARIANDGSGRAGPSRCIQVIASNERSWTHVDSKEGIRI
jgi:hypothetical protein